MKEKLIKLIDVKTIVFLSFTAVILPMLVMSMIEQIPIPEDMKTLYLMFASWYFGSQGNKVNNTQI